MEHSSVAPLLWIVVGAAAVLLVSWSLARILKHQSTSAPVAVPPVLELKRQCGNCQHFDLAEGQAVMKRHPPFLAAAAVLQPQQMGRQLLRYDKHACDVCGASADPDNPGDFDTTEKTPECHVCKGSGYVEQPVYEQSTLPAKASWSEFGACDKHAFVTWSGDSCPDFVVQLRAKA